MNFAALYRPFVSFFLIAAASAQTPPLTSPEVHGDGRVTFRLAAPNAKSVAFKGDWHADPLPMARTAEGHWSLTTGPLAPSTYIYGFVVDGVPIADPINPRIKLRMRTSGSLVEIPGPSPTVSQLRDVPHGSVEIHWRRSPSLGDTREIWVYTPPGYHAATAATFPVLYLLHGNNDRPAGWIDVGNIHLLADNLIAENKLAPLIIVMPVGHALPFGQRTAGGRTNTQAFEHHLMNEVVPFIEAGFRLAPGRDHRAIAGTSMGAEQALHVFFRHLDRFASAWALSPNGFRAIETDYAELLSDVDALNSRIARLWISAGRGEPTHFPGSQRLVEFLAAKKIRHVWRPSDGVHNYASWREELGAHLPELFPR